MVELFVGLGCLAALVVVPLLFVAVAYNTLVSKRNQADNAFASMDVQLKKRYDLIPNLVATVQQYTKHESETLTKITELRAKASSPSTSSEEAVHLNNELNRAMGRLMVQVEAYPELRASENFNQLQRSLNEVEEQLSASRRAFNAAVTDYNDSVQMVPTNMVAGMFGFRPREVFEIPEKERQNVDVKQLFAS
ncbi:MAG TPA: LemA family protein [Pirellulaceae bacterium]|jgi:LemA protein|nr:LemA family protein [Pirellulaceae bacterium]